MSFFSNWNINKVAQVAKEKVVTLNIPTFTDKGDVDGDTEDDSAVTRALRDYYKEKDGFVPDWLAATAVSPHRISPQKMPQQTANNRPVAPPRMQTGGAPAMLGDIFGDAPRAPVSAPPVQQQQYQPPPPEPQHQQPPPQQAPAPKRPLGLPGGPRGGLPGGPRAGVRPFMAVKREQQQQQRETAQSAPPAQAYQQPPPQQQQAYRQGYSNPAPSGASRQPPPPSGYVGSGASGPRRGFAAAAGETNRSNAGNTRGGNSGNGKPYVSATAPWSNGGDEFDDYGGYGGTPGYYGR
ncbi:hypothetical protein H072_5452 [Dactylellina haptotyla CBS 200.50]|uniref:Mso1 N-terminal domain-containing protein n=1 Tax=Dactylellina haptotyla (strain CBS 200.50) TaxID=1284197 RepID=S8BME8_DACHA|nr:hypothetical protein H072_5452 [Dactylellina haptotyla CBS 200.50]